MVHRKHRAGTCEIPPESLHAAHQTNFKEWGLYLDFFSLFQCITCIARCFACSFSTYPSVPDSIDGLFKLLKLCWLGKCLWWTIKFPATPPVSCFSCCAPACQKLSPSSVIADRSQAAVQELTGYWKGFCVTLNTLTVLRNSTRIIFVLLDVFWKTSNCTWLLKRSLSSWKCLILTALQSFPLFDHYPAGKGEEINHTPLLRFMYSCCIFTGGVIFLLFWNL